MNTFILLTETFTERTRNSVGLFLIVLKESEAETCWLVVILDSESQKLLRRRSESLRHKLRIILKSIQKSIVGIWFHRVADCVVSVDALKRVLTNPFHTEVLAKHTFISVETLESIFDRLSLQFDIFDVLS